MKIHNDSYFFTSKAIGRHGFWQDFIVPIWLGVSLGSRYSVTSVAFGFTIGYLIDNEGVTVLPRITAVMVHDMNGIC